MVASTTTTTTTTNPVLILLVSSLLLTSSSITKAEFPPKSCEEIVPGDLPVFLVNSDDPDQFVLIPLVDIHESVGPLYITDSAWNGTQFFNTEGTLKFEIPGTLKTNQIFGWGDGARFDEHWEQIPSLGNKFDLQTDGGDTLLLYCLLDDNVTHHFITGFSFSGKWLDEGLPESNYSTQYSALPAQLEGVGSLSLPHMDNYAYVGPLNVRKKQLQHYLTSADHWSGRSDVRIELSSSDATTVAMMGWSAVAVAAIAPSLLFGFW